MAVFDLFSKRQNKLRNKPTDVYVYDNIPQPLRVQIVHIWRDTIGDINQYHDQYLGTMGAYRAIVEALCREYGCFVLVEPNSYEGRNYFTELSHFLLHEPDPERILDAIELSFLVIDRMTRTYDHLHRRNATEAADEAIEELNQRFREHDVGYQLEDGGIIRVDSQLLHTEAVKPALSLLQSADYAGAEAEFLRAHEHYRHGRQKEALNECLKALESVMKIICGKRKWGCDPNATAKTLIQTLLDKGLIPSFWAQHFSAIRSTLEAGVPTARNRLGGHGQGTEVVQIPEHIAAYVLHQTAAAIVFLVESDKALP